MPLDVTASTTGAKGTRQVRLRDGTTEHYAQTVKSAAGADLADGQCCRHTVRERRRELQNFGTPQVVYPEVSMAVEGDGSRHASAGIRSVQGFLSVVGVGAQNFACCSGDSLPEAHIAEMLSDACAGTCCSVGCFGNFMRV